MRLIVQHGWKQEGLPALAQAVKPCLPAKPGQGDSSARLPVTAIEVGLFRRRGRRLSPS